MPDLKNLNLVRVAMVPGSKPDTVSLVQLPDMYISRRFGSFYVNESGRMGLIPYTKLSTAREFFPTATKGHGITDYEWSQAGVSR